MIKKIADKISLYNRRRKWQRFLSLAGPKPDTTILDVGFSDEEYGPADNFLEKVYPYPDKITAIGIEAAVKFKRKYPQVKVVLYRGGRLPFPDKKFDFAWSNAVIEHVGSRKDQLYFLKELKRVAKKVFVTTPNRHFPIEVHTRLPILHWLPRRVFERILLFTGKSWAGNGYMNLLTRRQIKNLLKDAGITKSKIIKNKLFFWTLDFIMVY